MSITDRDDDGIFETAARDSFWTLCGDDRALELSSGTVGDDGELRTEGFGRGQTMQYHIAHAARFEAISHTM